MKKSITYSLMTSFALMGAFGLALVANPSSASAKTYTNPTSLQKHNWYSYHEDEYGTWRYYKLHFAAHSVYEFTKTSRSGKWTENKIPANRYFFKSANKAHWYNYGATNVDNLMTRSIKMAKATKTGTDGKTHLVLYSFDRSNNKGGINLTGPYKTWTYFTSAKYVSNTYEYYQTVNYLVK